MQSVFGLLESTESRIGAVCAAYLLYALVFFVLGRDAVQLWPEIAAITLCVLLTIKLSRDGEGLAKILYAILALAFIADALNAFLLQAGEMTTLQWMNPTVVESSHANGGIHLNSLFYGMHLFLWNIAWAAFAFSLATQLRETKTYLFVAPLLLIGVMLLLLFQLQNFQFEFSDKGERLDLILLMLELIGIMFGLLCVLMSVNRGLIVIVMGFTLAAGNDIISVFDSIRMHAEAVSLNDYLESNKNLDAFWALSKTIILIGLLMQFEIRRGERVALEESETLLKAKNHHSGLSIYLLIFWLVTCTVAMFAAHLLSELPQILAMFIVLFSAACVISMSVITSRFDEVVVYLANWIGGLFADKLQASDRRPEKRRTHHWLEVTALDRVMATVNEAADDLRENVIFLGPERLNRPPVTLSDDKRVSCFLVMPFHTDWSDRTTASLRLICKRLNIFALRGDDIFRPTDILDDIWSGLMQSDFVIADITGNNANVFYELGMAHALGKPVLILTQNIDEVPFDLKSRRILDYDVNDQEKLQADLEGSLEELVQYYQFAPKAD